MAAFNFPSSPSNGDTYTLNSVTYQYDGTKWVRYSASVGAQGGTGSTGSTGAQGAQGYQGLQGAQAHISASAPSSGVNNGDLWWESDTGDLAIYYNDGSSSQWIDINTGPRGAQGGTGPTGAQGSAGATGAQGATGSTGAQGAAGAQGATGSTGAQGAAGAQGATGAAGSNASISSNADNRVITGGSGTNLVGEANLTFDGTNVLEIASGYPRVRVKNTGTSAAANDIFGAIEFEHSDTDDAGITAKIQAVAEDNAGNSFLAFYNGDGGNADERLRITSAGNIEVKGTRAGSLQANDDDALKLYTASTNNNIDRGVGITFYTHDGSGFEMGGTIQVAKENGTADNPASYMRFSTQSGSTTTERLRIASNGQIIVNSSSTPEAQLDIYQSGQSSTTLSMLIGANEGGAGGQGRTNSNAKAARIGCPHYTNAEESLNIVTAYSGATTNNLYWGGGTGVMNSATSHHFYTAANNTTTGGTERLRIDSSGRVIVGSSSDILSNNLLLQAAATNATGSLFLGRFGDSIYGSYVRFGKSRNGTIGNHTIVQTNDILGAVDFTGSDGSNLQTGARIQGVVDGTPGSSDMPGRIEFHTTPDGSTTVTERLRLTSGGKIGINYAGTPPSEDVMICTAGQASPAGLTLSHLSGGNRYGARLQTISGTNKGLVISELFNSSYSALAKVNTEFGLKADNTCKTWLCYRSEAGNEGIIDDFNVASVNDEGTGTFYVNLDRNIHRHGNGWSQSIVFGCYNDGSRQLIAGIGYAPSHGSNNPWWDVEDNGCRVNTQRSTDGVKVDAKVFNLAMFGDTGDLDPA